MTDPAGTPTKTRCERIERREAQAISLGLELHAAAQSGNAARIAILIKHGASLSARLPNGWTPLHTAAHHGRAAAVEALLAAGADPDALSHDGAIPLQLAEDGGEPAAVAALVRAGTRTKKTEADERKSSRLPTGTGIHRAGMQAQRTSGARA